jgi:bifunctional non-homologous end joining protein LigD
VVFDLDPAGSADFTKVRKSAREVRDFLRRRGADPKVMTTGKSGLHVYYKIRASQDFDQIRSEVRESAEQIVQRFPDLFTLEMRKKKRGDKIFLDYLRNSYAQTSVCPFSLRPNKCAGVATPIDWEELDKIRSADQYTYQNIFRRLGAKAS